MTFYKRTISIRKTVHFAYGVVRERTRPGFACDGEPIDARDISCTITVDVPVLTSAPTPISAQDCEELDDPYDDAVAWLHERGFEPDDEIGIEAQALPERCPFRKRTGAVVYRRVQQRLLDELGAPVTSTSRVLGVDADGGYTFAETDTPVVVRVRDIFPEYEPAEDK